MSLILLGNEIEGSIQTWDIFLDGDWHGSRLTVEQCEHAMHRDADIRLVRSMDRGILGSEVAEAVRAASAVHRPSL